MSNRAWMPLHITDYLADTGHLNAAEHGAYLMLIMHYWQNGSLPTDERLLARLARMTKAEWEDSRDVLAMLFGPNWTHKRIDAELAKADEIIEKRRNAALGRHAKSKEDASAVHVQSTSTDTGVPPRTLNQELKEEPNGSSKILTETDLAFDAWDEMALAAGLAKARVRSQARRSKLAALLRQHGMDVWREACRRVGDSSFCRGEKGDGWKADLDFVLQAKSFGRILEGHYDDRARGSPPRQPNLADALKAATHFAENRYDPRSDPSDESPRRSISDLSRISG